MSVIAITNTTNNIFLLSDGRIADEASKQVTSMKSRKVWKINEHTGFLWLGWCPAPNLEHILQLHLQKADVTTPIDLATHAAKFVECILTPERQQKLQGEGRLRLCILVVGYHDGQSVICQLDSENEDMFTPVTHVLPDGQSAVMGYNKEASDCGGYSRILQQHAHEKLPQGVPSEQIVKGAFETFVRGLESDGLPVGGDIFCEVLKPSAPRRLVAE